MRYVFAAIALLGGTSPAMAVVQAIHITGSMGFTGSEEHCSVGENYWNCSSHDIIGKINFDLVANVDGIQNPTGGPDDVSLGNDRIVYIYTNIYEMFPSKTYLFLWFDPVDYVNSSPGVLDTEITSASYDFEYNGCKSCENYYVHYVSNIFDINAKVVGLADPIPVISGAEQLSISWKPLPEPATWAMMLLGFGLVGASLRNRNSLLAA